MIADFMRQVAGWRQSEQWRLLVLNDMQSKVPDEVQALRKDLEAAGASPEVVAYLQIFDAAFRAEEPIPDPPRGSEHSVVNEPGSGPARITRRGLGG